MFWALPEGRGHLFGMVCPNGLLGAGGKVGPFENDNWVANVWGFQLLRGALRPLGFGRYRGGCWDLSGRVCPNGLLNYWTPVKKQARLSTRTGFLRFGNFSYYVGSVAHWVLGVT